VNDVFVVRPAWRREWKSFLLLALLASALLYSDLLSLYARDPMLLAESFLNLRFPVNWPLLVQRILLVCIVVVVLGILFRHYRHQYLFSATGVAHIVRIIGREERPLSYRKITFASKKQSAFEYLFGIGTVFLHSSGTDTADVVISGVASPKRLLYRIQAAINEVKDAETST